MDHSTSTDTDTKDRAPPERRRRGRGFFALDVEQFRKIKAKGLGLEEAATYIALLVSTDETNETSRGGINSVMNYTGLTRAYAKRAIETLTRTGFLKAIAVERKRARTVPRYELLTPDTRRPISSNERSVYEAIKAGQQPFGDRRRKLAEHLAAAGWLSSTPSGWVIRERANAVAFIPNEFARPTSGDSLLARLVNYGDPGPLFLAIDIYGAQDLMEHGGVPLHALRYFYSSVASRDLPHHRVHLLQAGRVTGTDGKETQRIADAPWAVNSRFWHDLRALDRLHIIEWAVYSANGSIPEDADPDTYTGRQQRPLGVLRNGLHVRSTPEARPAFLAYVLGFLLNGGTIASSADIDNLHLSWARQGELLAIENRAVQVVSGIATCRTVLRSDTEATRVWFRELAAHCDRTSAFILGAIRENFPQAFEYIYLYYDTSRSIERTPDQGIELIAKNCLLESRQDAISM